VQIYFILISDFYQSGCIWKFWLFVCLQLAIYCFESPKRNGNRGALIGIVEEEGEHFPKECLLFMDFSAESCWKRIVGSFSQPRWLNKKALFISSSKKRRSCEIARAFEKEKQTELIDLDELAISLLCNF